MIEFFKIKRPLDKEGEDNKLIFSFQLIGIFIISAILFYLLPFVFFLNKGFKPLLESKIFKLIIKLWSTSYLIYPLLFIVATITTILSLKKELEYNRIIEILFFENKIKVVITNRLGLKYKRKIIENINFKYQILKESENEISGVRFFSDQVFVGDFNFYDINSRTKLERDLLDYFNDNFIEKI